MQPKLPLGFGDTIGSGGDCGEYTRSGGSLTQLQLILSGKSVELLLLQVLLLSFSRKARNEDFLNKKSVFQC